MPLVEKKERGNCPNIELNFHFKKLENKKEIKPKVNQNNKITNKNQNRNQ
jgi:hypothetical protein